MHVTIHLNIRYNLPITTVVEDNRKQHNIIITHILKHYILVHVQILSANVERALEIYKKYTQGTKESSTPASVIKQYSVSDDPIIVIMDYLATPMCAAYLVTPTSGDCLKLKMIDTTEN